MSSKSVLVGEWCLESSRSEASSSLTGFSQEVFCVNNIGLFRCEDIACRRNDYLNQGFKSFDVMFMSLNTKHFPNFLIAIFFLCF